MNHRHLLPNELDLLLDGEVGFGVTPLKAHVDDCAECRAKLEEARVVLDALDDLPRFAPAPSFADRVMANVQVVEPWHVAMLAAANRLVPRTRPMRVVMAASASVVALGVSSAAVWLAFRADVAMYIAGLADQRARALVTSGLGSVARSLFGAGAIDAVSTQGPAAIAVGGMVLLVAGGSAAFGLRAIASASRRARE
jgi:hypothetical protein